MQEQGKSALSALLWKELQKSTATLLKGPSKISAKVMYEAGIHLVGGRRIRHPLVVVVRHAFTKPKYTDFPSGPANSACIVWKKHPDSPAKG